MNESARLFDFIYEQQKRFPKSDMLAAKENGRWVRYSTGEVIDTSLRLGAALLQLGLSGYDMTPERQDKIAIISRNRPEWLMLDLAVQQAGLLLCPIYPTTGLHELRFIFNDASIQYVFVSGDDIRDKVEAIRAEVPSLKGVFALDEMSGTPHWTTLLSTTTEEGLRQIEQIRSQILPSHCATIIYTSGTTGVPKGVMLSHRNIVMNVLNATRSFPFPEMPEARSLSFLPLNHIFERVASYIYMNAGISIYYAESLDTIGENLKEVRPTLFSTVPRLLEKVYDKIMAKGAELKGIKRRLFFWAVRLAEQYEHEADQHIGYRIQLALANRIIFRKWREALGGQVKYIITGGAACQVKLLRIFNAARIPVYEGYGPTENSPVISVNGPSRGGMRFGTVGEVIQGQEVKLEPDGEICVKGPSVMMGYYKRPDLTAEVIIDGWLHTGDIGVYVDGRYLKITDRKKEMFKTSGGKYVAPQVIENRMKESPFIEQIMVVGADRKFVGALIIPAFAHLHQFMSEQGVTVHSRPDLVAHPLVQQQYQQVVEEFNRHFNHTEKVRKFVLLSTEWSVDSGEMTPKLSMRRKVIEEKNKQHIDELYA